MSAREAAFKTLAAYRRDGARPAIFLDNLIRQRDLDGRDAALATELCLGTLRNLLLCDFYIAAFSSVRPGKMEPAVLDILRLSVYQLLFLSKIPARAAVNEGTALVKKSSNPRAAALVNAVLRKISQASDSLPQIPRGDMLEYLSIKYSHPLPLVRRFAARLGIEDTEKLLAANNTVPYVYAQVNTLRTSRDSVMESLEKDGCGVSAHPVFNDSVRIKNPGGISRLDAFLKGLIYIQDPAAFSAVKALGPTPGSFVVDGCAAPGGKSLAASLLMGNKGRVLSCDIYEKKLPLIAAGAKRLGINIIETAVMDASEHDARLTGTADAVIADLPCSGLGTIRKKPEIRYKSLDSLDGLPSLQLKLLSNLSSYVRPGGALLYSTCTLLKEENEGVASVFLENNRDFSPEDFEIPGVGSSTGGMLTLWPHIFDADGFYICKMRKKL